MVGKSAAEVEIVDVEWFETVAVVGAAESAVVVPRSIFAVVAFAFGSVGLPTVECPVGYPID